METIPFLTKSAHWFFMAWLIFMVGICLVGLVKVWIDHNKREVRKELEENEELLERMWKEAEKPSIDIEV